MTKPNTFIIGFSKCGTTALANYLNQHNDCFVPKIKEPRYMVKESILKVSKRDPIYKGLINTSVIDSSEYYQLYSTRKEKVLIDASVQYINHLNIEFDTLKIRNKSSRKKYQDYYTPATRDLVYRKFKNEIETFGYQF